MHIKHWEQCPAHSKDSVYVDYHYYYISLWNVFILAISKDSSENILAQIPARWFGRREPHTLLQVKCLRKQSTWVLRVRGALLGTANHEFLNFFSRALPYSVGMASADARDLRGEPTIPPEEPGVWVRWGKEQLGNEWQQWKRQNRRLWKELWGL